MKSSNIIVNQLYYRQLLKKRQQQRLWRQALRVDACNGVELSIDRQPYISFASNDYLGLSQHPQVIQAFQTASQEFGVGSTGSPLVSGYRYWHQAFEEVIADYLQRDKALLMSNAYQANRTVLTSLVDKHSYVLHDRHNHASLLDGSYFHRAKWCRYRHLDNTHLASLLKRYAQVPCWIVSESMFSVNGDKVNLANMADLARQYQATLCIDETHSFGLYGAGRGLVAEAQLNQQHVSLITLGCGKALGSYGGIVAGKRDMIEALLQLSREYMYSTALPPACAAANLTSLRIMRKEHWRRERLAVLIDHFKHWARELGLAFHPNHSAIQMLVIDDNQQLIALQKKLMQAGFYVAALRSPSVIDGKACLRISLSVLHTQAQIKELLFTLKRLLDKLWHC